MKKNIKFYTSHCFISWLLSLGFNLPYHRTGSFSCCRRLLPFRSGRCGRRSCRGSADRSSCGVLLRRLRRSCHEWSVGIKIFFVTEFRGKFTINYLEEAPLLVKSVLNGKTAWQGNCQGQNNAQCEEFHCYVKTKQNDIVQFFLLW